MTSHAYGSLAVALCCWTACAPSRVSEFGRYEGYSTPDYTGFARSSVYVPARDGTRLAVDIYRPANDGVPTGERLPVLLIYSRYWRAIERPDGSLATSAGIVPAGQDAAEFPSEDLERRSVPYLIANGYVVARADARGTGASFGWFYGEMSGVEARDGYDLVEWLAGQPWSDGNVGMIGGSYPGMSQFLVASQRPPHLKAIFPAVATFDEYRVAWSGSGVLRKYGFKWLASNAAADGVTGEESADQVARVTADATGAMRDSARAERLSNPGGTDPTDYFTAQVPAARRWLELARDAIGSTSPVALMEAVYSSDTLGALLARVPALRRELLGIQFTRDEASMLTEWEPDWRNNLAVLVDAINQSGIPIYHWGGWRDFATLDTWLWYGNVTTPQKLTMGPWTHGPNEPDDPREDAARSLYPVEQLRWFDHWLKAVGNGVMDEPSIRYAVMDSPSAWEWRTATAWPLPDATVHRFAFGTGPTGSVASVNDGGLSPNAGGASGSHSFVVDYQSTMGEQTRYHDAIGFGPQQYPDLVIHARTALTYTSEPLASPLVVVGHPVVVLWVTSTAADGDFNVYLEEVDSTGRVQYLTDGVLRASHRTLGEPFYDSFGLPWSVSSRRAVDATPPLTAGVAELRLDLQPTANLFEAGHRIRVVITGADAHTNLTVPVDPPPRVSVFYGDANPSRIELPVQGEATAGQAGPRP